MKRRQFIKLASLGILTGGLVPSRAVLARKSFLKMGIFPRRNPKATYLMFTPLANMLSRQLGINVVLQTTKDFASFWRNVENQRYDLVHFNQYHYLVANKYYGYQAVAMLEETGSSTISGAVIVRDDSGIDSVEQLKGKKIIFGGGKKAMQSYIVPKWLLKKNGLDESQFYSEFARNPPNALISVYQNLADAAGSGDAALQMNQVKNAIDTSQLRILLQSEPMAHLPWAISDRIDRELFDEIKSALVNLDQRPEGVEVLKMANLTNIIDADHDDYAYALEIIQEIYGETLGIN